MKYGMHNMELNDASIEFLIPPERIFHFERLINCK